MTPIVINTYDERELSNIQKAFLNSLNKNEILGNFSKKYEYLGVVSKYDSESWIDFETFDTWSEYIVQWNVKLPNKKCTPEKVQL